VEYYSAIMNKEMMSFAGKRMELEIIMLTDLSKTKYQNLN
jgi:hypothetical protein